MNKKDRPVMGEEIARVFAVDGYQPMLKLEKKGLQPGASPKVGKPPSGMSGISGVQSPGSNKK